MFKWLARLAAWSCLVAIAVLSVLPGDDMVRTPMGGRSEHVIAYALTTLAVANAHRTAHLVAISGALVAYAGCLEYLQRYIPGRSSALIDFAFSASGVGMGALLIVLLKLLMSQAPRVVAKVLGNILGDKAQ